jgi:hypothetical protein
MNMPALAHPPADDLRAFGVGLLDGASSEAVARHLEACADCRAAAGHSEDEFLHRLRESVRAGETSAPDAPPAALPPLPGCRHHDILRELGRGGMGTVYLAWNRLMGRREVLKVMHDKLQDRPGAGARFLREIQAAASLRHPHVVTAYSVQSEGDRLVLAMEYVEGETLDARVRRDGPPPVGEACDWVRQAALGLQHAFERGVAHRDVKPQNLILSQEGGKAVVKVLDFGLAKATSEKAPDQALTAEGALLGTPEYVAPEQIRDPASADVRADIYALGCTLYFLVTGRPPFRGKSVYETLQGHESAEAPPLSRLRPGVPAGLAAVAARMMAKDPARRFQTAAEAAAALAPFASTSPAAKPRLRRSQALVGAAICLVLVGLAALLCGRALRVETKDGAPPAAPPGPAAGGFTPLYNGRDLTGWSIEGPKTTTISLAGGALAPDNHGPAGYVDHLLTKRSDYTDFHFRCRFLLKDAADAATVLVRVDPSPIVFGGMRGYEVSVRGSSAGPDGKPAGATSLALSSRVRGNCELACTPHYALPADAWHALDVIAAGDRLRVLVNGGPVLDHRDEGRTFRKGALALVFPPKTTARFRDLEIQELKPEPPPPAGDGRMRWAHQAVAGNEWNERWGVFQQAEGKRWVESVTTVPRFFRFVYTETDRTDDYVELEGPDGRNDNRIRLYGDHADIGPPGGELHYLYTGGWEK